MDFSRNIHINVSKGKDQCAHEGASGNNPLRIEDDDGYPQMLWNHWVRGLKLEPGDKGHLVFIPDEEWNKKLFKNEPASDNG